MSANPNNVYGSDPSDLSYVSIKNWSRRDKIVNQGKSNDVIGRPGPITGSALMLLDMILTFILKLTFNLMDISIVAFDWLYNIMFGAFTGFIPQSVLGGTVISLKFFRYILTVLMPPFGILLSKGLYGWFSILICIILTYVNFLAGIIYAFVITSRNRYSDQYEDKQLELANKNNNNTPLGNTITDNSAFFGTIGFLVLFGIVIFACISYF